ncbi:hypothetical protein [Thiomicrorhabdus chilensis]|uniref:hypothetical protein n=1 Tax=Thiomicrorhabdus chilensis TaxID=63656 RepID=UPI0003FA5076|nr:hypothetical protein [Thiomicrorhabdus chilensis]
MQTQVTLKVFTAQKGTIDSDSDGNALPPEKHFDWASVQGLEPIKPEQHDRAGNAPVKLSCTHAVFDEVRKLLPPGEVKELVFECDMRSGAKQKIQLFATKVLPAK